MRQTIICFVRCPCSLHVHLRTLFVSIDYVSHHETISLPQLRHEMNALFAATCVWKLQLANLRIHAH